MSLSIISTIPYGKSIWAKCNAVSIVMEYANNGDLYQKILQKEKDGTRFTEVQVWKLLI